MTGAAKLGSEQPNVETASMQEDAPPIELPLPITAQDVYLVQASGTCPVPHQTHERSRVECLTAGPYVAPEAALEELEDLAYPAPRTVKYRH